MIIITIIIIAIIIIIHYDYYLCASCLQLEILAHVCTSLFSPRIYIVLNYILGSSAEYCDVSQRDMYLRPVAARIFETGGTELLIRRLLDSKRL